MTLAAPKLDDRTFQQLVDEAKERIPHYIEEWTDHNVSDPGVTLIELFAWMVETLLYRLNRVPDRYYIKFMEFLGVTLQPPRPAQTDVTFWLSAAQDYPVLIPGGTEVATTQPETEQPIVFTTDCDFHIRPARLAAIKSQQQQEGTEKFGDVFRSLQQPLTKLPDFEGIPVFSTKPQEDEALYFGFESDLSRHILQLKLAFETAAGGYVHTERPPYLWEVATSEGWQICDPDIDQTLSLNATGNVRFYLPQLVTQEIDGDSLYWIRVRVKAISAAEAAAGMTPFETSPRLRQVVVAVMGGTVPATHARSVVREFLGRSDGSPGQTFDLKNRPALQPLPSERLILEAAGEEPQKWALVEDFADSKQDDRHFTLDCVNGRLRLGPAIRQPDGRIRLYGAIPPKGSKLYFSHYRHGGGVSGNVQAGELNILKSAIPMVARVTNQQPATGGQDAESLEAAQMRVPQQLRTRRRAVTAADFEWLATNAPHLPIERARCLQDPERVPVGTVYLLAIPKVAHPDQPLTQSELELNPEVAQALKTHLDQYRLLTTRLVIGSPVYQGTAVTVTLKTTPGADRGKVESDVLQRLYRLLNPLIGGAEGAGWPFGRSLYPSDVFRCLQDISQIQFIQEVELRIAEPAGPGVGESRSQIPVSERGVIVSGLHQVAFV